MFNYHEIQPDSNGNQEEQSWLPFLTVGAFIGAALWEVMTNYADQQKKTMMQKNHMDNLQQKSELLTQKCELYTKIDQYMDDLQQKSELLTQQCELFTKINQFEELYQHLLKQQLQSILNEEDEKQLVDIGAILQDLYKQCSDVPATVTKAASSEQELLDSIESQTAILKDLLDKNHDWISAGKHIQQQQEMKISKKDTELRAAEMPINFIESKAAFFRRPPASKIEEFQNDLNQTRNF